MTRPIELSRHEAESIVDLIEAHSGDDQIMLYVADSLRKQWGMVPRWYVSYPLLRWEPVPNAPGWQKPVFSQNGVKHDPRGSIVADLEQ